MMNNTENRNSLDCAIVRDLLSLYHDDVVSDTTKAAVESHLEGCEPCREEYDSLCRELPLGSASASTKDSFADMMKLQKAKRVFITITAVVVTCVLLAVGYFAQLTVPLVSIPAGKVNDVCVYRIEDDEDDKFFIMFDYPMCDGATRFNYEEILTPDGNVLNLDVKKPLVCADLGRNMMAGPIVYSSSGDITEVRICGETVWTAEANGANEVPDYAYAYDIYDGGDSNIYSWTTFYDQELNAFTTMTVEYLDGLTITWDADGNVISEETITPPEVRPGG